MISHQITAIRIPLITLTDAIPLLCNPAHIQAGDYEIRGSVMNHKVFIPVTDEMLYERPDLITAPLRPYQIDNPCFHWMATIESPEASGDDPKVNMRFDHHMHHELQGRELQGQLQGHLNQKLHVRRTALNDAVYQTGSRLA
jgi:hypothetical protein